MSQAHKRGLQTSSGCQVHMGMAIDHRSLGISLRSQGLDSKMKAPSVPVTESCTYLV